MAWPFGTELHLFLLLTIGKAYKGDEEHFSTVWRLTGPKEDLVAGEYVVPVTAHLVRFKNTQELATTTDGGNKSSDLELATIEGCARFYKEDRGVNRIGQWKNVVGDRCQTRITIVADYRQATILWGLHENKYVPVERRTEYTEIPPGWLSSKITSRSGCWPQTGCTSTPQQNAALALDVSSLNLLLPPRKEAARRGCSSVNVAMEMIFHDQPSLNVSLHSTGPYSNGLREL
jgi:hypothetical protein